MALLSVRDEWSKIVGRRFLNSHVCLFIGGVQLCVCAWALAQHVFSFLEYKQVLHCDFENGTSLLSAADAIIFDVGLFHVLWGIRGCVAEYMDGGFGRLGWCLSHSLCILLSLPIPFIRHPRPSFMWPLLVQQSTYGVGLLMLCLSALPRVLVVSSSAGAPFFPIAVYFAGTLMNFMHLYVYWHWYWHVSSEWQSVKKVRFEGPTVENPNMRRRDCPVRASLRFDESSMKSRRGRRLPSTPLEELGQTSTTLISNGHVLKPAIPRIIEPCDESSEVSSTPSSPSSPPAEPIYATRLSLASRENRILVGSDSFASSTASSQPWSGSTASTELMEEAVRGLPRFFLPHAAL